MGEIARMKYVVQSGLLAAIVLSSVGSAWAQELSPPDNAVICGSHGRLTLSWPGEAKEYYVQIQTAGKPYFEATVKGNSVTVDLRPGLAYRWNVAPVLNGLAGLPENHAFSFTSQSVYHFDGVRGGAPPARQPDPGVAGRAGGPGAPGQSVLVKIHPSVGDLTCVEMEGDRSRSKVYHLNGSSAITVTARGGEGGEGGPGGPGPTRYIYTNYGGHFRGYNGSDGGPGGPGGPGGKITVQMVGRSSSKGWELFVKPVVDGGRGGPGGLGGEGGPPPLPQYNQSQSRNGNNGYGYGFTGEPGSPGHRGPDGVPGAAGQVLEK